MPLFPRVADPIAQRHEIRGWRAGQILMEKGRLRHVRRRYHLAGVSIAQVWWQATLGRPSGDLCRLDYHQPWGMPGILALDYVLSGDRTRYATFVGACHVLDWIAECRGTLAIVAHVSNATLTDRLLRRLGWERHVPNSNGRHWIKRFYDGYPRCQIERYLGSQPSSSS